MDEESLNFVCQSVGASAIAGMESVQTLWSGYGEILRVKLLGSEIPTVIVKQIAPPTEGADHPRGWDTDLSHQRKLKSYQVEASWYRTASRRCDSGCRVPRCYAIDEFRTRQLLVLEDLDSSGYPDRHHRLSESGLKSCLSWLANFHAAFLRRKDSSGDDCQHALWETAFWETGTYWHLSTRPDEYAKMPESPLKSAAEKIDRALRDATFQTLVHGDAKVANFCFDRSQSSVAAVDFQYVGGGCGMKDVAYFLGSSLTESECESRHRWALDFYFECLRERLSKREIDFSFEELEKQWRDLFPLAWADFYRFLVGWCPGHPKLTSFAHEMVDQALARLGGRRA